MLFHLMLLVQWLRSMLFLLQGTVASENDPAEIREKATFSLPYFIQNPRGFGSDFLEETNITLSLKDSLFWAKAVKVTAISNISPFETTLFIDAGIVPCRSDFGQKILHKYNLNRGEYGEIFDIAAIPQPVAKRHEPNQIGHWLDEAKLSALKSRHEFRKMWGRNSPLYSHATRILLLNVTSRRTRIFLDRYNYEYLFSYIGNSNNLPEIDQPSFGRAALSMFVDYGDKWKDVDLKGDNFCWTGDCGRDSCLMVHQKKK